MKLVSKKTLGNSIKYEFPSVDRFPKNKVRCLKWRLGSEQFLQYGQRFEFRKVRKVQAVVEVDVFQHTRTVGTREFEEAHVVVAHTHEQRNEGCIARFEKVGVKGLLGGEVGRTEVEVITRLGGFDIRHETQKAREPE